MKPRKHPRTGLALQRTQCVRCERSFPGRVLRADQAYCPECEQYLDKEVKAAKFAPAKRGPLIPEVPNEGT
jgi:NAD-dependent SIR2 family protein deacetylase